MHNQKKLASYAAVTIGSLGLIASTIALKYCPSLPPLIAEGMIGSMPPLAACTLVGILLSQIWEKNPGLEVHPFKNIILR